MQTVQLRQQLRLLLELPTLRTLFTSISRIDVTHTWCLTVTLYRPDYWLPFRLASCRSVLTHPDDLATGCGPFYLKQFSPELARLENHPRYHLQYPLTRAAEYWITSQLFGRDLGTSCRHPVQITIGNREKLRNLRQVSSRISLGFCYLILRHSPRLSKIQAQRLVLIIRHSPLPEALSLEGDLTTPGHEVPLGWSIPQGPENNAVPLSTRFVLLYHLSVEPHVMTKQLR